MKNNFFKTTSTKRLLFFLLADIILISVAVFISFLIRFDGAIPKEYFEIQAVQRMILLSIIFCLPIFYFFKLYSFSWSYVSTGELVSLFKATTLSFLFLGIVIFFSKDFPEFSGFPRSVFIMNYFLVFVFCGGIRLSKRIYFYLIGKDFLRHKENTLIVGAGDSGEQILRSIISSKNSPYNPIGFVDDSRAKKGLSIHGVKVLGKILDMPKIIKRHQITQLIVALPTAGSATIKNAVEIGREAGIKKIKIVPHINEIIGGIVSFRSLKDFSSEELLGRERIFIDENEIKEFIKDKTILITGAAGSIGSELSRQLAKFKPEKILLVDQDETGIFTISNELFKNFSDLAIKPLIVDVRDEAKIKNIFEEFRPNIVFHAAAYKHVPLMEELPDEAIKNNILGTEILTKISLESRVEKFVFISSDKAVNPVSVMGATKRVGEMICQVKNQKNITKFVSVRFGNVLDSRGSVIPIFREQIKKGGPIEVTSPEMKRYFMLISEACILVLQAGAMGKGGEVFVLDMGDPVKIYDLAKEMIKLSGYEPDKDIAIVFIGKRPGEKDFEELLTSEEGTVATQNKKIFKAKLSDIDPSFLEKSIERLKSLLNKTENEKIKQELIEIVSLKNKK
jgi:FlaA1/EpsC-like NDP-sugar epimerase